MDAGPVIRAVADDVRRGVPASIIGARFHAAVVALVVEQAGIVRTATGLQTVAVSGGVFQNALLLSGVGKGLRDKGFTVLRHQIVPPNDGGIALGQLMIAAAHADHQNTNDNCDPKESPCA
jgi:hydrogenase maturation protein HypF